MPYCWNAASMIAAVADVGRPRASSDPIADPAVALAADSGRGQAADGALAELRVLAPPVQSPLQPERQEGGDLRAAGRDGAERHAECRSAQPGRQRLPEFAAVQVGPLAHLHRGRGRVLVDAGGHVQHLAEGEQADRDDDDVDAVEQRGHAERVPGRAADARPRRPARARARWPVRQRLSPPSRRPPRRSRRTRRRRARSTRSGRTPSPARPAPVRRRPPGWSPAGRR